MANREYFKSLAQETLDIVSAGQYTYGNKTVELFVKSRNIYHKDFETSAKILEGKQTYKETRYCVKNESVVKTIHDLRDLELSLGVLNFASAYHPGGGFLNGAMAQEEVLAYCSNLYDTLSSKQAPAYYKNNKEANSNTYTDGLVITNNIFFRDEKYNLVFSPSICTVITCPAVNMNLVLRAKDNMSEAKKIMKNRMRKVLYAFIDANCTNLIIGAWGCGVFKNDPEDIASAWHELLVEECLEKYFESITFTVLDKKEETNIKPFIKHFR